jgi:FlaG/FlaF family flagellin (archaellin)
VAGLNSKRNLIIAIMAILAMGVGIGGYMTAASSSNDAVGTSQENGSQNATGKWMDIHGVGVFTTEKDNSLYIATHNGLLKRENGNSSSGWVEVGNDKSDMMGFTISKQKGSHVFKWPSSNRWKPGV